MLPHQDQAESGFTLIELLVVIIIIGILAAIAIPLFLDQRKLAVDASVKADVRNTLANIQTWQASDEANRTKAIANTGEFTNTTNKGKVSQTTGNSIGVSIDSAGAATVCAYNSGGKTYLSGSTAYVFNPATGQFNTGSCATGSATGGTGTSGSTATQPVVINLSTTNGWQESTGNEVLTGTATDGSPYVQTYVNSGSALIYNYDESRTLFQTGHKYVVTIKSGAVTNKNMRMVAGGNSTSPVFIPGSYTSPATGTITFTSTNNSQQISVGSGTDSQIRVFSVSIQDIT